MGIADDEADATEPTLDERAQEGQPVAALVPTRGGHLDAHDAAHALAADGDGDERGHVHDAAGLADLVVERVEPEVRIGGRVEAPAAEGLDLGIEDRADAADLALADTAHAEGRHELLHTARRDAVDVGFLDDREQGLLGPPARLEQTREVAAVADLGDGQLDGADAGVPAALTVAVAMGQAAVGGALAMGGPGELAHLGFHDRLGHHLDRLAEQIGIAFLGELARVLEQRHPVGGHRVVPPVTSG